MNERSTRRVSEATTTPSNEHSYPLIPQQSSLHAAPGDLQLHHLSTVKQAFDCKVTGLTISLPRELLEDFSPFTRGVRNEIGMVLLRTCFDGGDYLTCQRFIVVG